MTKYIERERYLTECRDNAARGRIIHRRFTREERTIRKYQIAYFLAIAAWAVALIATIFFNSQKSEIAEEPTVHADPVVAQLIVEPETTEKEAVLNVFDPVRDDIPMDAELQRLLYKACGETGIRYELALALIWQETDFRNVVGDGGESYGFMQVQPKYHGDRMSRLGVDDLNDPYSNFLAGCDYLAELIAKNNGLEWALHAYNGGPNYANDMARVGKVSQYAENVKSNMDNLTAEEW